MRMNLPCEQRSSLGQGPSSAAPATAASCHLGPPTADPASSPTPSPTAAAHKAGRVVIPQGLGIAKSLHGRVRLDDLILEGALGAVG